MSMVLRSLDDAEPLARLAPPWVMKRYMASATSGGLGHVVAALLR